MNEWHLVCSLEGFVNLRDQLDKETNDHVHWDYCGHPAELPCLAFADARYAGGAYNGYFVFCYRSQAERLAIGLILPPGNAPG